ncbi:hypothetical protein [Phaeobacter sp. JH204B]|uniref:hypothetical protein n=1 Tax=Phaeobacter sp. JH204B TaxID=3112503 RepID=UPI003A872246
MRKPVLNLAAWIGRRRLHVGPYADHIIHSVQVYEDHITELQAENARLREALEWFEKHRLDAIARAGAITAREDCEVNVLCEKYGYGAVMDSAARQWACKPDGRSGAFFVGGCIGDTTARAALSQTGEVE